MRFLKFFVILYVLVSFCAIGEESSQQNDNLLTKIGNYYKGKPGQTDKLIPYVYYINEAGVMVGAFYYNTNLFNNGTDFSSILMYAPFNKSGTSWSYLNNYPLGGKFKLGGALLLMQYNDIRHYWPGNDSPSDEVSESERDKLKILAYKLKTGILTPAAYKNGISALDLNSIKGYGTYHGYDNAFRLNLSYLFDDHNSLKLETGYEILKSQVHTYKTDSISLSYDSKYLDNEGNPRNGARAIITAKKNLNVIAKDDFNNWDYYKLTADFRKFIPIFKNSTIALRAATQSSGGKEVIDKDRSLISNALGEGDIKAVAPFFDMAVLGDLETMKGYYYYRFVDRHSLLLQGELRFPFLIENLQGNVFYEAGRVASKYTFKDLTEDMKTDFGVGLRYYFNEDILIRTDVGHSTEGTQIRINVGQTF